MNVYSIFDRKAMSYGPLMTEATDGTAARALGMGLRGTNSPMEKYPSDFELCRIGYFDPVSGTLVPEGKPEVVANLSALIEVGNNA